MNDNKCVWCSLNSLLCRYRSSFVHFYMSLLCCAKLSLDAYKSHCRDEIQHWVVHYKFFDMSTIKVGKSIVWFWAVTITITITVSAIFIRFILVSFVDSVVGFFFLLVSIGHPECCCLNSNTLLQTCMHMYIYIYIYIYYVRVIQYLQSYPLWSNTF